MGHEPLDDKWMTKTEGICAVIDIPSVFYCGIKGFEPAFLSMATHDFF